MKKIKATLKGIPLTIHVAVSEHERAHGYHLVKIVDGEGMLFELPTTRWIPLSVEGLNKKLDAVGIYKGKVYTVWQRMGDGMIHAVYGEAALELPAGFVEKNGIVQGDKFIMERPPAEEPKKVKWDAKKTQKV